tara:strand:- start:230 stop:769 length:540 start_codon:yes stop_codon:yes gene_type:complete
MAGQRLTDKTALGRNTASDDMYMVVDKSDTTGSSVGTSKKVDAKYIIQTDKITLSNSEYKALNSTEKVLVAAPGANNMIIPLSVVIEYTQGATANTASSSLYLGFKGIGSYYWDFFKNWTTNNANVSYYFTQQGSPTGDATLDVTTENQPFIMWLSKNPQATATGSANIYVTYQIVNIS